MLRWAYRLTRSRWSCLWRLVNGVVEKTRKKTGISIAVAAAAIGIPRMLIDVRHGKQLQLSSDYHYYLRMPLYQFSFHFCYCKSFCWVLAFGCLTPSIHPLHMAGLWIPLLIPLMKAVWCLLTAMSLILSFI